MDAERSVQNSYTYYLPVEVLANGQLELPQLISRLAENGEQRE